MRQLVFFVLLSIPLVQFVNGLEPQRGSIDISTTTDSPSKELLTKANESFQKEEFEQAIVDYEKVLAHNGIEKAPILKKLAISHASLNHPAKTVDLIEDYLSIEFDTGIFTQDGFSQVKNSSEFKSLLQKYTPKFTIWSFLYLYVALIGFYIALIINFNRKIDRVARILISAFIFIHSIFIFNICINISNYQYQYPHSYLMSTSFSFLYGPLLYFYFKRITQQYTFKKTDLLHLLPTLLFLIYIIPIYGLSGQEKLHIMLESAELGQNAGDSKDMLAIVVLKLVSLATYGFFIRKLYLKSKHIKEVSSNNKTWQKNIYGLHVLYIVTYALYGILIVNHIFSGIIYHTPIVFMALMVMYLGYSANVQPSVFGGLYSSDNRLFFKYEKSGLTQSLSNELREQLLHLFDEVKIYKESDLNLGMLAERLNTTRHNASQVINEHFEISFHELVNKYRIEEAKTILDHNYQKNMNIIDVAYEVGYNNKVTFNKAFKKETDLTPSEYQRKVLEAV
ncbi:helix-turn-helix domain-containing protein [Maribacter algicola]|uniref:Helix-turn-helix domain-containing protein n=1 Tax=Meishania litoralis TaxID=3434685 RepID=A0ACC7LJE4_9FLAO